MAWTPEQRWSQFIQKHWRKTNRKSPVQHVCCKRLWSFSAFVRNHPFWERKALWAWKNPSEMMLLLFLCWGDNEGSSKPPFSPQRKHFSLEGPSCWKRFSQKFLFAFTAFRLSRQTGEYFCEKWSSEVSGNQEVLPGWPENFGHKIKKKLERCWGRKLKCFFCEFSPAALWLLTEDVSEGVCFSAETP